MGRLFSHGDLADADSMLAAGGGYYPDNTSMQGNLSMMILCEFGSLRPLRRVQGWALERLIAFCVSGDLRYVIVALALRSFTAIWVLGQRRLARSTRHAASRTGQHADSTVAAAGG
jgi:hypothetical protein